MTQPPGSWPGNPDGPTEGQPATPYQPYQPPAQPYQPPAQPYQPPAQPYQPPAQPPSSDPAAPGGQWAPPPANPATPSWSQPDPGQVAWAPPSGAVPPTGQWDQLGPQAPTPTTGHRRRGWLLAAALVVVLVGGGTATYVALSNKNSNGSGSPQAAVQSIINDLNESDLVAALDDLPPGERTALASPFTEEVNELKRLNVLSSNANPSSLTGITFNLTGLKFAAPVTVNNHVQLVQITGGSLDVSADATKVPFTSQFIQTAFPNGLPTSSHATQHVDIAAAVQQNGHPLQLAAQKVSGKWYPSLFYTIAASGSRGQTVTAADYIPAVGGSSPTDAVTKEITALTSGDTTTAIQLLSPDELAAVHDYGGLIVKDSSGSTPSSSVKLSNLAFNTSNVSGGAVRVTLKSLTVTIDESGTPQVVTVSVDGSCYNLSTGGQQQHLCASDLITAISKQATSAGLNVTITSEQHQALTDLIAGLNNVGVDTTQSNGQWFVNPVRSYLEITTSVLSGLQGNDLLVLIKLFQGLGH
jgi:hypothetical protein